MLRIIVDDCVFLLLWSLILCTFVSAEKDILKCMIMDGDTEIHFKWVKTKQLLANEHLPIWIAKAGEQVSCSDNCGTVQHELQKNFMRDHIGKFILYHDVEKLSAVVYYENLKTLHGMIDTRYFIANMPINECNRGHQIDGEYVKRHQENMNIHENFKPLDLSVRRNDKSSSYYGQSSDQYEIPSKRQRLDDTADEKPVTIFYPEILLFVPYDTMESIWKSYPNNALTLMVRHFIVYFNGIDMLMSKLSTDNIKIHLNLAGIVFEESRDLFGFMIPIDITVPSDEDPPEKIRYIDCQSTSELVSEYINTNKDTFPDDSFDFYFIPSRTDSWWTAKNIEACGISLINDNYAERWWSNNHKSGIIIHHGNPCEYVTAAHEIAHLMNIKHESQKKGYSDGITQCYAIMQETNPFCPDCLKWTNQNIEDLQKFSKEHRNRCFLLNQPRSLHPYGYPMRTLSCLEQCNCYGYHHWPITNTKEYIDEVPHTNCDRDLICGQGSTIVKTILPLDGTPCADNKVCWNKICQNILYGPGSALQGTLSHNK